jgi:hypothetical protein
MEAEGYSERLPVGRELYRAVMEGRGRRFADLEDVMSNENPQEAAAERARRAEEERRREEEAVGRREREEERRRMEEERRRAAGAEPPPPRLPEASAPSGDDEWSDIRDRNIAMMSGNRGNIDRLDPRDIAGLYNRNMGMLSSGMMDGQRLSESGINRLRENNRYMMQVYRMRMAERENEGRAEERRANAAAGREQGRGDREELIRRRRAEREDIMRRSGLFEETEEAPLRRESVDEAINMQRELREYMRLLDVPLEDAIRLRSEERRRRAEMAESAGADASANPLAVLMGAMAGMMPPGRRIPRPPREMTAERQERARMRRAEQESARERVRGERAAFRADDRGTIRIRQGRQAGEPAAEGRPLTATGMPAGDRGLMGHLRVERGREAQAERDAADAGLRRAIAAAPVSPEEAREAARGYPIPQSVSRTADVTFRRPRTDYSDEQLRLLRNAAFNERLVRSGLQRGNRNPEFGHLTDQDLMNIGLGLE